MPSDFAMASSITSIACAPYCEYGFGVAPICLPKSVTKVLPSPFRPVGGWPATLTYESSNAVPFDFGSEKPSGAMSVAFGTPCFRSLISFAPLLQMIPPRKIASAPRLP